MKKSKLYGITGSALSCILLFLLLWFIILPGLKKPEDEGIMVSFGETYDGGGSVQTPAQTAPTKIAVPKPVTPKPIKQDILTQTDNSVAIAEQKKKEKEKKEQQLLEQQRLDIERKAAEQKRKQQEAIDKANSMNGMFGNSNSKGKGNSTGDTQQGNPVGKGSAGGNSWSLNGRSLTGSLVSPSYNRDVEGKVTVNIRVDQNGNVSSTSIGSPTTISDSETIKAAFDAAKRTHFSSSKDISSGSITYNFKLN